MTQAYRRKGRKILGTLAPEKSAAQANILRPELYMFVFGIKVLEFFASAPSAKSMRKQQERCALLYRFGAFIAEYANVAMDG